MPPRQHPSQTPLLISSSVAGPAAIEQDNDDDGDEGPAAPASDAVVEPQHRGFIPPSYRRPEEDRPASSPSSRVRPLAVRVRPVPVRVVRPAPRPTKPSAAARAAASEIVGACASANSAVTSSASAARTSFKAGAVAASEEAVLKQVTVPQEAAAAFYDSAYTEGVTGAHVHQAVLLSHEWHRKWTHQHETGHGYQDSLARDRHEVHRAPAPPSVMLHPYLLQSHEDSNTNTKNYRPSSSSLLLPFSNASPPIPSSSAMDMFDRYAGAKNPSPEDLDAEPRKRVRSALREQQQYQQQHKHSTTIAAGPSFGLLPAVPPLRMSAPSGPVRPVALRIPRPSALRVGPSFQHQDVGPAWTQLVPQDIFDEMLLYRRDDNNNEDDDGSNASQYGGSGSNHKNRRHHHQHHSHHHHHRSSPRAMSPLTVTSSSGGSVKGATTHEQHTHQQQEQQRMVHFIEPDQESVKSVMSSSSSLSSLVSLSGVHRPAPIRSVRQAIREARDGLLEALAGTGGNVATAASTSMDDKFHQCLAVLEEHGSSRFASEEGMWLSLTAPNYFGSLGNNDECDARYTLGRMAFDMFSPTSLICSLQGNFNSVERVSDEERSAMLAHVPKALQDEVMANTSVLRTYKYVQYESSPCTGFFCFTRTFLTLSISFALTTASSPPSPSSRRRRSSPTPPTVTSTGPSAGS
jgi:hypothetical protein